MTVAAALLVLALVAGCHTGLDFVGGAPSLELDPVIETVGVVRFETTRPTQAWVEYGATADYGSWTPITPDEGTAHEVRVVGLPAGDATHWRVVATDAGGERVESADQLVSVPATPNVVPDVEVLLDDGAAWGAYTVAPFGWAEPGKNAGVMVLDATGRVVWYFVDPSHRFVPWAERTADGRSVIALITSEDEAIPSSVVITSLDARAREEIEAPRAHHAMAQVGEHGVRFAYVASEVRVVDGEEVAGDRIVEVDEAGASREVWNAFDHLDVIENLGWQVRTSYGAADWTHANGLDYDPDSDAYYLSFYQLDTIACIDRATGAERWWLGGPDSDFAFVGDAGFARQHAPERSGDILYLFDNGRDGSSRAVGYRLDEATRTATLAWEWETPEASFVGVLGDVDPPSHDQILTAWGDLGQVNLVGLDGTPHRRFDAEPGAVLGRADRFDALYE